MIKRLFDKIKEIHYMHYISAGITAVCLVFAIFVFPNGIVRIGESCVDFGTSIAYYAQELFCFDWNIHPTVINVSKIGWTPFWNLPETWEDFTVLWGEYWRVWATKENLTAYMDFLGNLLYNVSRILLMIVVPWVSCLYLMFKKSLSTQNNDYNVTSKPLAFFQRFGVKVWIPIKRWVRSYIDFVKANSIHYKLWLFIWAYNFNVITIILEFFAFYLYFVVSFDTGNLYKQVYKLFCDLSVVMAFISHAMNYPFLKN